LNNLPARSSATHASTTTVIFTTTNTGGSVSYSWTNDNITIGLASSGNNDIAAFTATNSTLAPVIATITVTPHFTNDLVTCDGPAKSFTITVNPTAEVDQPSSQVVCNGRHLQQKWISLLLIPVVL
jgi:hypothetical protein